MKCCKITSLILSAAMLSCVLLSCAESKDESDEQSNADIPVYTEAQTEEPNPLDNVETQNFGGRDFVFLTPSTGINGTDRFTQEIYVEAEIGEIINDAVYARNLAVVDKLNVNIKAVPSNSPSGDARRAITSDDGAYDVVDIEHKATAATFTSEGLTRNWNDIPIIDMTQAWWNQNAVKNLTIKGKLYMMSGAMLISEIDDTLAMVYDKKLAVDNNLGSIYDLVFDGSWTLDTFGEQVTVISNDLNGDGKMTPEYDLFGYAQDPASMTYNWVFSCDMMNETVDEDGAIDFNVNSEKIQDALVKMADIFGSDCAYLGLDLYTGLNYFQADRIYVYAIILRNIELLRDMNSDFGIIPYPKYDEEQSEYYNHVGAASPIMVIPITNYSDDELLGSVLEVMAITSYQTVKPAYFDVALKEKYARDEETQHALDIILASRTYNLTYLGGYGLVNIVSPLISQCKTEFASAWAKQEKSCIRQYTKFVDKFE